MNELELKRQNFDNAKLEIKNFANEIPFSSNLKQFEENGILWMSKNVTGTEMNELVKQLQDKFRETNSTSLRIIREFNNIYNVFDVLDKEYIKHFTTTIENLKVTSEQTQIASNKAIDAQKDIKRTIDLLKNTIEELKLLESESKGNIEDINSKLAANIAAFNRVEEIKNHLDSFEHLYEIDTIWSDVHKHSLQITEEKGKVKQLTENSEEFLHFKNRIENYKHIDDIDETWSKVHIQEEEIKKNGSSLIELKANIKSIEAKFSQSYSDIEKNFGVQEEALSNTNNNLLNFKKDVENMNIQFSKSLANLEVSLLKQETHLTNTNNEIKMLKNDLLEVESKFSASVSSLENAFSLKFKSLNNKIIISYVIIGILFILLVYSLLRS